MLPSTDPQPLPEDTVAVIVPSNQPTSSPVKPGATECTLSNQPTSEISSPVKPAAAAECTLSEAKPASDKEKRSSSRRSTSPSHHNRRYVVYYVLCITNHTPYHHLGEGLVPDQGGPVPETRDLVPETRDPVPEKIGPVPETRDLLILGQD